MYYVSPHFGLPNFKRLSLSQVAATEQKRQPRVHVSPMIITCIAKMSHDMTLHQMPWKSKQIPNQSNYKMKSEVCGVFMLDLQLLYLTSRCRCYSLHSAGTSNGFPSIFSYPAHRGCPTRPAFASVWTTSFLTHLERSALKTKKIKKPKKKPRNGEKPRNCGQAGLFDGCPNFFVPSPANISISLQQLDTTSLNFSLNDIGAPLSSLWC